MRVFIFPDLKAEGKLGRPENTNARANLCAQRPAPGGTRKGCKNFFAFIRAEVKAPPWRTGCVTANKWADLKLIHLWSSPPRTRRKHYALSQINGVGSSCRPFSHGSDGGRHGLGVRAGRDTDPGGLSRRVQRNGRNRHTRNDTRLRRH